MYQSYLIDTKHGSGKAMIRVFDGRQFSVDLCDLDSSNYRNRTTIKINGGELSTCKAWFYLWTDGTWRIGNEFKYNERTKAYDHEQRATDYDRYNSLYLEKANGKYGDLPSAKARAKAAEILTEIAHTWAPANQAALNEGERQMLQDKINDAKKEAAKLYEQFSEQQKLIQQFTKALKAVPNA